jgi:Trk-type K+ transport system membrane component
LVLSTTAVLLIAGTLLVLALERGATLKGLAAGPALRRAFFQAVTPRTAGFNTVDIGRLALPTACLLMALMFVGASPTSTGGGIKTSTLAVLVGNLYTAIRSRPRIEMFNRTVSKETVARALAVVTTAALAVGLLIFGLTITEGARFPFEDVCFEAVSAFGTVGLSRGITPRLTDGGRLLLTAGMLLGRIGPLTVVMAMYRQARPVRYEYPEESVVVG